jgi:hypothetical protein
MCATDTAVMRITADALRISALVAAGVASGYLWRAALAPVATGHVGAPVTFSSVEPFVHREVIVVPQRAPKPTTRRRHVSKPRLASAKVTRPVARVTTRAESSSRPVTKRTRSPAPRPRPQPPAPSSPPTSPPAAASVPAGQQTAVVTPPAVSRSPSPAANETGRSKGDKRNGNDKGDAAASPPQTDADRNRPGWGHGDENHNHDGPRGK